MNTSEPTFYIRFDILYTASTTEYILHYIGHIVGFRL